MVKEIDPGEVAKKFRSELRAQLAERSQTLTDALHVWHDWCTARERGHQPLNIASFLTPKVETGRLATHDTVRDAIERMEQCGCTALPVLDGHGLCAARSPRALCRMESRA